MRSITTSANPCKSSNLPKTLFREPPPSATNQREKILSLLREAAPFGQGVSGDTLRYDCDIRQAPTRIFELKNEYGYRIETVQDPETRLATYFLRGDPPEGWRPPTKQARFRLVNSPAAPRVEAEAPKLNADSTDSYAATTGKPRAPVDRETLFLFDRGNR
jgi:hypothetical protein